MYMYFLVTNIDFSLVSVLVPCTYRYFYATCVPVYIGPCLIDLSKRTSVLYKLYKNNTIMAVSCSVGKSYICSNRLFDGQSAHKPSFCVNRCVNVWSFTRIFNVMGEKREDFTSLYTSLNIKQKVPPCSNSSAFFA